MPRVVKSTIIDAPVDRVWSLLRDFNGFDRWHPAVATSAIERGAPSTKSAACGGSASRTARNCASSC